MDNFNLSFERSILSSIIFEPSKFDELSGVLKSDDFYLPAHQDIYNIMALLTQKDMPIDEEFIKNELIKIKRFDAEAMLNILTVNPISNIKAYVKELKTLSISRKIHKTTLELQSGKLEAISELQNLKFELENVGSDINYQKTDANISNIFDKFDIDFQKIDEIKSEYLFDNFIVKNEITMLSARPSEGKSLLSVALSNMLLHNNKIEQVFYLDGDNSPATLKNRNIHHLKQNHGDKFRYFCGLGKIDLQKIINTLLKIDLSNCLIIFDSIKNFMNGGDRDKNKDVSKVMEVLKQLRNKGATIIFLHHNNKKQRDFESDFAGSSAFMEDATNAFRLSRNEYTNTILLEPYKARTGELHKLAFTVNNHILNKVDFAEASITEEDQEIKDEIINYLSDNQHDQNARAHTKTLMAISKLGYARNKVNAVLKKLINTNWTSTKTIQNNRTIYTLIVQETVKQPTVTVYQNEDLQNTMNKSNRSNKSYIPYSYNVDNFEQARISGNNPPTRLNQNLNTKIEIPIL